MSDFVLHATVDSCYHGVQSILFKAQMKVQPSNLSFLTFKSYLPTECRSKEDLNSIAQWFSVIFRSFTTFFIVQRK